jgi:hypothetical protein
MNCGCDVLGDERPDLTELQLAERGLCQLAVRVGVFDVR